MLETKCVGDNLEILMTDLRCWFPENPQDNEKCRQHKVTNITVALSKTHRLNNRTTTDIITGYLIEKRSKCE